MEHRLKTMLQSKPRDRFRMTGYRSGCGGKSRPLDDRDPAPYLRGIGVRQVMALPDRQVPESALCLTGLTDVDQTPR
jgi:hypothetical protein